MSDDVYAGTFDKPLRVEIIRTGGWTGSVNNAYFKKGQFAYVIAANTKGGSHLVDKSIDSQPGEAAFLVSKTPQMRGGALWMSADALRFTKAPKDRLKELSDDERVAVDLMTINGGSHRDAINRLVPDQERRGYIKTLADQLKSVRPRNPR